ncbi:methylated-DNA-[protein]-cysteine S-methyltransferase [Ectothiorhodosinus mongolicus]|uniref:methylated-DNA--[protein]-cysteine S-methyltransferase n=1 Tax=Ectothiorhodosinus mongolicus TaxID=233100 RepID=A0A1R3W506_9GAMM|nr:methylated-DNA--[protein]-cysteine S-methyltransferase [Ectothiorhodosinus mongolicus]ULX57569.1 methylated-DNA--[protein]-cysteine S-methyltransferase [Ectothiorhodosinus mongolicus]SIT72859.1 methylated-DNA-[protein]-cysteine S-methyltransferase [Ectothiorhodosinus mongolicus]
MTSHDFCSPLGTIRYRLEDRVLVRMEFVSGDALLPGDALVDAALDAYFACGADINLPYRFNGGTDFQRKVWQALTRIPKGSTCSYGELAKAIGHPRSARAIGQACRANPLLLVVPCHRVIGATGALSGYGGVEGIDRKSWLLTHERNTN